MVAYNQASSGGFTLKSGQTNPNTLQMMTKDMAFAMYNLSLLQDQMYFWQSVNAKVFLVGS
jgi:hypothetical protein